MPAPPSRAGGPPSTARRPEARVPRAAWLLSAVALLLAACGADAPPSYEDTPVAARVNGQPIHEGEVESAMAQAELAFSSLGQEGAPDRNALCKRAVGNLVLYRLKLQEAVEREVSVPSAAVDRALATADALREAVPEVGTAEARSREAGGLSRRAYDRLRREEHATALLRAAVDRAVAEELPDGDAGLEAYWQARWRAAELDFALDCDLRYPADAGAPPAAAP